MSLAPDLPAKAPLPGDLLEEARAARVTADRAEVRILELALEWAYAHPVLDAADRDPRAAHPLTGEIAYAEPVARDDEADVEAGGWYALPQVTWAAPASFAAAVNVTTGAGAKLIRDALQLAHRLPRTWRATQKGRVPAWRARRVADAVAGQPDDVAAYVDEHVHAVAGSVGVRTLDRLVDEALLRLHAEDRELDQLEALDRRHATLHTETINHTGIVEMTLRGDYTDLAAFDAALGEVADALAVPELAELVGLGGCAPKEKKQVRRALAVGVLAHPESAATLLQAARTDRADTDRPRRRPAKQAVLHVHLAGDALYDLDPVARLASEGTPGTGASGIGWGVPVLTEQVREWLGRTDTHVTVRPVLDTAESLSADRYEIPDRIRSHVDATHTCVFPWCEAPAAVCDVDHLIPWKPDDPGGGPTSTDNLAPECRHHHRLKTHAGWRVARVAAGTYHWTDPHGRAHLRTPHGTRMLAL